MNPAPAAVLADPSGIKILVADDQRANRLLLEAFLQNEGHVVLVAEDGAEAVEMHRTELPDLVLMDIMMPVMDGLEAARRIAANCGEIRTPLLFLTAVTDQQTMIEGLSLGDDFIAKPIDLEVLRAKLRAFIRLAQTQHLLREQHRRIERLNDDMRRESEVAAHVLGRVLAHTELPDGESLQYRVQPSAMFSGDMVLARRTPGGRLHLLLADAVGHGLPAAINILPLFFPFDGMARKGCSLATVARELNRRVRDLLPLDRFIAATLVSIDFGSNSFEIWNGGNPPALILGGDGTVVERIDSMQMALGLNPDNPALFEPRRFRCGSGQQLLLCSDGIWESPAFADGDDPFQGIAGLLAATPPMQRIDALFQAAIDAGQSDDLSAVLVSARATAPVPTVATHFRQRAVGARLSLQFGPEALRRTDALSSVLEVATSLGLVETFPALSIVLPELFANALDHGVLGLDGGAKHGTPIDCQAYGTERQRRLDALAEGFVTIEIEPDYLGENRVLRLVVADSGGGFDWHPPDAAAGAAADTGRGLQRVRKLSSSLHFGSQGSEVIVLLPARHGAAEGMA